MSLLHHDNFNHYSYAQALGSGEVTSIAQVGGSDLTFASGQGRDSLYALAITSTISCFNYYWRKTVSPGDANGYQGVRVRFSAMPSTVVGVFTFSSGGSGQITVALNPDGTLSAVKGSINDYLFTGGSILGTSSLSISAGVRYFIEGYIYPHTSSGMFSIVVNGIPFLTLTGKNTNPAGSGSWNGGILGNFGQGGNPFIHADVTAYYNDWYLLDGISVTGPNPMNSFLGDIKTHVIMPTVNGYYQEWTPSASGDHYILVDDNPPNDDTDYVQGGSINLKESYDYVLPVPISGGILATTLAPWVRKTDSGTRKLLDFIRQGGSDYLGSGEVTFGTTYQIQRLATRYVNPATNAAFANGATIEQGVKIST